MYPGEKPAETAKFFARRGVPDRTASHLHRDKKLPISKKGELLAKAYATQAEMLTKLIERNVWLCFDRYQGLATRSARIAQGLARAAKRA